MQFNYATDNSLLINKAYKTLRDPYERGLYLLKLFNTSIQENESIGLLSLLLLLLLLLVFY